jgi:hypothetical protein
MSGISLYQIEDVLIQLVDLREQAEAEGDSEALKVIDQQLREYLTKEAAKVTSYVGLIRSRELTAVACGIEIERLRRISIAAQNDVERLKANALAVMQQFGVRELKATPGGGLRIQGNGGKGPLDVDALVIPDVMRKFVLPKVSQAEYNCLMAAIGSTTIEGARELYRAIVNHTTTEPDAERIREALAQRVPCPECKGQKTIPQKADEQGNVLRSSDCACCNGAGTIPNTVPGAKLLERGEHIRVL